MKALENCRWTPRWVSHLGCIKGCLDFLGIEISDAWLYGGTGHDCAFQPSGAQGLGESGIQAGE